MKAVLVSELGANPKIGDIDVPEPGEGEVQVKTIYTAMNPVDMFMASTGLLVESWPLTPGCEVAGIITKVGHNAKSPLDSVFKEGDRVFSCSRLGMKNYGAWEEYLLVDAHVTIPKPDNISLAEASTLGVASLTACLGVFDGLGIDLPDPNHLPGPRNQWALVFGGAGSVGQATVQLFKAIGFKVLTTCSKKSFDLLKSLGADETIDYKLPEADIIDQIKKITNSQLNYAFDAVSVNNALVTSIFAALPTASIPRLYTTTNDWDPPPQSTQTSPLKTGRILLGEIGRPDQKDVNAKLTSYIPLVVKLLEKGLLKPSAYSVEGEGIEGIPKAWEVQKSGVKGSVKVFVKVAGE